MGMTSADPVGAQSPDIRGAFLRTLGVFRAPTAANQFINHATPGR